MHQRRLLLEMLPFGRFKDRQGAATSLATTAVKPTGAVRDLQKIAFEDHILLPS